MLHQLSEHLPRLLLGALFFAASLTTLFVHFLVHLLDAPAREVVFGLLTAAVYVGAIAFVIRLALDQPATGPTIRQEPRP